MLDRKTYLTSELVTLLELPRSTVVDWLKNYSAYLEYENCGKRKAYTESALNILREISAWRNEGKSGVEIENLLSAKYGLRPEVASDPGTDNGKAAVSEKTAGEAGKVTPETNAVSGEKGKTAGASSAALAVRAEAELLPEKLADIDKLAACFREIEEERRRSSSKRWYIFISLGVLAVILLLAGYFAAYRFAAKLMEENRAVRLQMENAATEQLVLQQKQGETIAGMEAELDKRNRDYEQHLSTLQAELAEQRKAFAAEIKKLEANADTREKARVLMLRNEFARIQKEKLAELEKLSGELAASKRREEELRSSHRRELETLQNKLKNSEVELSKLKSSTSEKSGVSPAETADQTTNQASSANGRNVTASGNPVPENEAAGK